MFSIPESGSGKSRDEDNQYNGFEQKLTSFSEQSHVSRFGLLLIALGICMLTAPLVASIQSAYSQRILERRWEQACLEQPAPTIYQPLPKAPTSAPTPRQLGLPSTKLIIRQIDLSAVVVDGVTSTSLGQGPGHFPGTAYPGEAGNCCIAAHRNMAGSWFRRLNELSSGSKIVLRGSETEFVYQVTEKFAVLPRDTSVLNQAVAGPTLTLITCTPVPHPTHRLVVIAKLIEKRASNAD